MEIENKDFWEREDIIHTQDKTVENTTDYEAYLYEKAKNHFEKINIPVEKAKIFGCGTGREIKGILNAMAIGQILATDISGNMIAKGKENIAKWNLQDKITMEVADAITFEIESNRFELVTFMNNMLNYIKDKNDRETVIKKAFSILKPNGVLLGVVHNQVGTPQKTFYFLLRNLLKPFLKNQPGNKITGFNGFTFMGYYFRREELIKLLSEVGFKNIEVKPLSEYYAQKNVDYNRLKGYNNLLIFATK